VTGHESVPPQNPLANVGALAEGEDAAPDGEDGACALDDALALR
jgi:hypothetical protein